MSETFSVKAILSAEDGSFRSVFGNAQSILQTFSNSTSGLTGGLSGVMNMVKSGLGFGVLQGIGQQAFNTVAGAVSNLTSNLGDAVSRYDTLQQFPKTMELMGFKTEDTARASKKLVDAIDGLPTSLDGITANTQNIAMITGNLDGATDTAIALNNAFLMSGASTAEAERGLTQYVQMMSAGKVDMQSWRTLLETMSPALTKVAESFGYTGESAKNDLYAALQSGEISFTDFNNRLVEMNNGMEISGEQFAGFAELARTSSQGIQTSMQNVKTAVVKNLANMITEMDNRLRESGESIAGYFDKLKGMINASFKTFIDSSVFQSLIDSAKKTVDAMSDAFNRFAQSPAMKAVHDNLDIVAHNLGVILPNVIKALGPVISAVAKVATGILAAISDTIARVTSSRAFMIFCENIGKAVNAVGSIVEKVIRASSKYFEAILSAANEVMTAFGKTFNAIKNTAEQTDTAGKLFGNFQKVLDLVKNALIKVAEFLEKHHTWILKIIEHLPQIIALMAAVKVALLVIEKIKAFKNLIDQVISFGKSMKDAVSNVGSFVSTLVSKFTSGTTDAGTQIANMASRADTSWMYISKGAATAGSGISSGIGAGASGALSSIMGIAGPIIGIAGAIGGAVMGIVTAVMKWREEQYKAGQAMAELTEEEQALIDKNKELVDSYGQMKQSSLDKVADSEAEAEYARALRDEYSKLLDVNGNVIEGKEKQAAVIQEKLFEAIGLESSNIQSLQEEYRTLVDSNGNVIAGYENRAAEIRGELSEAMGYEITNTQEVMSIQDQLMTNIDNIIDKKRLEAEASILTDAYVESEKKKHELHNEELELLDLLEQKQSEYTQFLTDHGVSRAEELKGLSITEQGYFDDLTKNIEEINGNLDSNARAQERCDQDKQISMDAMVAVAEEDYSRIGVLMSQYNGDLITAEEAVRTYSNNAQAKLTEQANNAETEYQRIKDAYDKGEKWATETLMSEASARRDFSSKELNSIYNDTSLHYEQMLQKQAESDQREYQEAKANFERISKMSEEERRRRTDSDLGAARERLINAETNYKQSEEAYSRYMSNINETGRVKLSQLTQTSKAEMSNTKNVIINEMNQTSSGVVSAFSGLYSNLNTSGINAMNGLESGLSAKAQSLFNTAQNIAFNIASTINSALMIHSPSRLMAFSGRMIDEGLISGMKDYSNRVNKMAGAIAYNLTDSMNKSMHEVVIPFPDMGEVNRRMARMTNGGRYVLNSDYNYNGAFQATIEVPVNLNGREVSRITVDTDSQEQYYNQKRFYR